MELPPALSPCNQGQPGKQHQLYRIALAVLALLYAGFSYLRDDFYIMGKHSQGSHYHGVAASLLEAMLIMAAAACLVPVIGVYDTRAVRPDYERWRRRAAMAAYALMGMGMTLTLFNPSLTGDGELGPRLLRWLGWLGVGALMAQLGRLPPAYLKAPRAQPGVAQDVTLPAIVAYLAVAVLGLIALALLMLSGWLQWRVPTGAWGFKLVFGSLGLGIGFWARSILRRAHSVQE
ncbi:hypothetical protein [Pseudogulbenkiania subflava]|uniref:Uncharacterized protein n=1 Tax=Pseudogulbenkiania subflava DSM 22618 TaxID=1123014 RepID=A0A1Y6BUF0_9NEIS|nr:hypothetical protein [Pseudogulbenkiania subflava]SMF28495.1 hypothetical protein SAMN02745746_02354 [Pseudogulbenkiania subflava DSM 22618]